MAPAKSWLWEGKRGLGRRNLIPARERERGSRGANLRQFKEIYGGRRCVGFACLTTALEKRKFDSPWVEAKREGIFLLSLGASPPGGGGCKKRCKTRSFPRKGKAAFKGKKGGKEAIPTPSQIPP